MLVAAVTVHVLNSRGVGNDVCVTSCGRGSDCVNCYGDGGNGG